MAGLKLTAFSGIAPKVANRMLPEGLAQISDNCRLISGALRAFSDKLVIATNTLVTGGDVKTIFRMNNNGVDCWLSWLTDVDCVRSQIAGDTTQRIYWTGDNEPRMSNLALAVAGGGVMPNSCFVLGVAMPLIAPTVTPTGGTGAASTRAYVETFVTPFGEESAPSPVSTVQTGKVDSNWAITALNTAPINSAGITGATYSGGVVTVLTASTAYLRVGEQLTISGIVGMTDLNGKQVITSIVDATHFTVALTTAQTYTSGGTWTRVAPHNTTNMTRRLYRTYNGQYYFVVELPIATNSYTDAVLDANLGNLIPSIGWIMPPANIKGMIALPNGFNAAFVGNELCFSEPWYPHAWPAKYRLAANFDIVGIGAFGSSIAVGTKGMPYVITGTHPSNLSMEKTEVAEPCISKRGFVDIGSGILYPSPNGMVYIGISGVDLVTKNLFSRDEWLRLNPASLRCTYHNGMVFGWHDIDADLHTGFTFNLTAGSFASTSATSTASYVDPETNNQYVVYNGAIYQWDSHPYNTLTYDWKSKVYNIPHPVNFGYARIDAEFGSLSSVNAAIAADIAFNAAILASGITYGELGDSMLGEYMLGGSLLRGGSIVEYANLFLKLQVYGDGVLRYSKNVTDNKSFTLPAKFKATDWEFRLSGNISVYQLDIAENALGLRTL